MKNVLWFVAGLVGGFVAAHYVNKDPRGHEVLAELDGRITEFTDRIGEAYRAQESRIDGIAADVKDAASAALSNAKDVAGDVADSAKDFASDVVDAAKDAASNASDAASEAVDAAKTTASKLTD